MSVQIEYFMFLYLKIILNLLAVSEKKTFSLHPQPKKKNQAHVLVTQLHVLLIAPAPM